MADLLRTEEEYLAKDGSWTYRVHQGLEVSFTIKSIKCALKLSEIYDRVQFQTDKPGKKRGATKAAKKKRSVSLKEKKKR